MPELEQSRAIEKNSERGAPEKATGQTGDIAALVQAALSNSPDRQAFRGQLHTQGFELYIRGKTPGVVHLESGKKHRLKTLNLELFQAFEALPEAQLNESQEKTAPEGEKEKGAETRERGSEDRHQSQQENESELNKEGPSRESNNEAYVKYDSNADSKFDPASKQNPKSEQGLSDVQKDWKAEMDRRRSSGRDEPERDRE